MTRSPLRNRCGDREEKMICRSGSFWLWGNDEEDAWWMRLAREVVSDTETTGYNPGIAKAYSERNGF